MSRMLAATVLTAITCLTSAQPITLGNANMPGSGDTLRYTNVSVNSLPPYQHRGPAQHWDFSLVNSTDEGVRGFQSAFLTPYFFFFIGQNQYGELVSRSQQFGPVQVTDYYNFYKKQNTPVNAFVAEGAGATVSNVPLPAFYTDNDELYIFPLKFQNYDSTTFRFSTMAGSLIPVRYSKTGYRVTRVDGWGTVTTPYGTESCLRLITTQYSTDTIAAVVFGFPVKVPIPNNVRSYQWMTQNAKIPYMEITGPLAGNMFSPNTVRYRGFDPARRPKDTGISEAAAGNAAAYPNPAKDFLMLDGTGFTRIVITDLNGKVVLHPEILAGDGYVRISLASLPAGIYNVLAESLDGRKTCRFIHE